MGLNVVTGGRRYRVDMISYSAVCTVQNVVFFTDGFSYILPMLFVDNFFKIFKKKYIIFYKNVVAAQIFF